MTLEFGSLPWPAWMYAAVSRTIGRFAADAPTVRNCVAPRATGAIVCFSGLSDRSKRSRSKLKLEGLREFAALVHEPGAKIVGDSHVRQSHLNRFGVGCDTQARLDRAEQIPGNAPTHPLVLGGA